MGEWLGHSLTNLRVDGSSLFTASQIWDDLNSPLYIRVELIRTHAIGRTEFIRRVL